MSKYVVLSFDDGRKDTYTNAVQILNKYNLKCTINITTDFIEHPENYDKFGSAANKAMTIDEIQEVYQQGFEIANHSAHHNNDVEDILEANQKLKMWGIAKPVGLASPFSYLTKENGSDILDLVKADKIKYIRSGIQVSRNGFMYKAIYALEEIFHSKRLFYLLNKEKFIPCKENDKFFLGVSITKYTTVKQIKYLMSKVPDNYSVILIFHSILEEQDDGYGNDKWYWNKDEFEILSKFLSSDENVKVVKNIELI